MPVKINMEGLEAMENRPGLSKLERLLLEEDVEFLGQAVGRAAIDPGERVSLEDAAARFGIDLDGLAEKDPKET